MGSSAIGGRGLRWTAVATCALGAALAAPEWVPEAWTREDGPVEWVGFACLAVGSVCAFVAAARLLPDRRAALLAAVLGMALLAGAGEEISWGQRLFEIQTPEALVDGNAQDELNLHNLAGVQHKAILIQLGLAGGGAVLPWVVRRRAWARVGFPGFAGYLAYRGGRGISALADWGVSDHNSEAAEVILSAGLAALAVGVLVEVVRTPVSAPERQEAHAR